MRIEISLAASCLCMGTKVEKEARLGSSSRGEMSGTVMPLMVTEVDSPSLKRFFSAVAWGLYFSV